MVQLFYYESRGKNCQRLLKYDGHPCKVLLFPYEGWARPAGATYWVLEVPWWTRKRCNIVEVTGTKKTSASKAKIVSSSNGDMHIVGKFKKSKNQPDFRLLMTSNVSNADFQLGYSMTGTLERGDRRSGHWEMTHFAMIKRKGY